MKLGIKLGALVGVSVLFLTGCSSSSNNASSSSSSDNTSYSAKSDQNNQSSQASNNQSDNQPTSRQSSTTSAAWTATKNAKLATFMSSWGQVMGQSYERFYPGHNTNFYGMQYPSDLATIKINLNEVQYSGAWSTDGTGSADYNVVAIYSDCNTAPDMGEHLYFFAFHNGQPIVLVSQQTNGDVTSEGLHFSQTQNASLNRGFNNIVAGRTASVSN